MASAAQSMLSPSSCAFSPRRLLCPKPASCCWPRARRSLVACNAVSEADESDCNDEECAPEKEVGKLSADWLAGDRTKVVGTFPPKKRGWTGYVEKDTAGQTNIYSVEPIVYVAESAISSGAAGTSAEGSENTAAVVAGLALVSVAAASSILIQVSKNQPAVPAAAYSGPPLSYYINKFKPVTAYAAAPALESPPAVEAPALAEEPAGPSIPVEEGAVDASAVDGSAS